MDNVAITAGSGTSVATDDVGGVQFQKMKVDMGGDGATVPLVGDATYGLPMDIKRSVAIAVTDNAGTLSVDDGAGLLSVDDGGGSLTVDAVSLPLPTGAATEATLASVLVGTNKIPTSPATDRATAAAPFAERLSDGTNFYDGAKTGQLPAALVTARLDVNLGACPVTVPVSDAAGTLTVDDGGTTLSVDDGAGSITVDAVSLPLPTGASTEATLASVLVGTNKIPTSPATDRATAAAPFAERLSDGTNFYDGAKTGQLPAALVTARLDVNLGACPVTVPVSDAAGTLTVDDGGTTLSVDDGAGSLTVDGTVTANQGTPVAIASAWPVKVGDGTNPAGVTLVGADYGLKVDVIKSANQGQADRSAFVEATGVATPIAGVLNETIAADPAENTIGAVRITAKCALHANLRNVAGTEIGTNAAPVQMGDAGGTLTVDAPVGTPVAVRVSDGTNFYTNLPTNLVQVAGSAVAAAAAGIPKAGIVDEAGTAFSETNPLPVRSTYPEHTRFKNAVTYSATQTDIAIFTPTGGKRYVLLGIIISPTASGVVKVYDNTSGATNMHFQGTPNGTAPGSHIVIALPMPMPSEAVNNVLRYSTGAGATGDITVWGYEV